MLFEDIIAEDIED